jgi:hypothetical protein
LRLGDFVPASDALLRKELLPEAEKSLGLKIKFETINGKDLQARITSAIQFGTGASPSAACRSGWLRAKGRRSIWESWWRKTVIGKSGSSAPQAQHFQVFCLCIALTWRRQSPLSTGCRKFQFVCRGNGLADIFQFPPTGCPLAAAP